MRRRSKPHSLYDNIAAEQSRLREQAASLPPGSQKDALLDKVRQLETASHMEGWLSSTGLLPPR